MVKYDHSKSLACQVDWLTLLQKRANDIKYSLDVGRHAFELKYPHLYDWENTVEGNHYPDAELTLALNIIPEGSLTGDVVLAVSKPPCYLCERWLNQLAKVQNKLTIHIPESQKKLDFAWQLPWIEEIDVEVINHVWEKVDEIVYRVNY